MQQEEQFLVLSMYTYLDLVEHAERAIDFIERMLELLKPLSPDLRVQPLYPDITQGRISRLDERILRRVQEQLRAGKIESLVIAQQDWTNEFIAPGIYLQVQLTHYGSYLSYQRARYPELPLEYRDQSRAKSLTLAINRDLLDPQSYLAMFNSLVELGLWTIEVLDTVYGFVAISSFGRGASGLSTYERRHLLVSYLKYDHALRDKCRGVFHVNLLTEGHIAALGNISSLASLPGVRGAESRQIGNGDVLVLQVGEALSLLSEGQMQTVEEQIAPILPPHPAQAFVDLLNPGIAPGIEGAIPELEALLSSSRMILLPNGAALVYRKTKEENVNQPEYTEVSRRVFAVYQEHLNGFPWYGRTHGGAHSGDVYPGWLLQRIASHGNPVTRVPNIWRSSLMEVAPFEATLWLGSSPSGRLKQALADLFTEWAGFDYPGYNGEQLAVDLLDIQFREREVVVQAEIRAHRGFVLATLISMLDLFSVKQARITELVLGQIEDLDTLLAEAGQ